MTTQRRAFPNGPWTRSVLLAGAALLAACGGDTAQSAGAAQGDGTAAAAPPPERLPPGAPLAAPRRSPVGTDGEIDITLLGHDKGVPSAPVKVIEMSDFGCGYCRQFHEETWPTLLAEYVETGKVEWKMIPFVMGRFPNSDRAALAGECAAEQGRFADMGALLFRSQRDWMASPDALDVLRGLAVDLGLDRDRFQRCMSQGWMAGRVAAASALSRQLGVRGTPTFFVVGHGAVPGAIPLDLFRQVLDSAYAQNLRGAAR